jgi:hypothetical protein
MTRRVFLLAAAVAAAGCGDSSPDSALGPAGADPSLTNDASGPVLTLSSNVVGTWASGEPTEPREVFAGDGLRFFWNAEPGKSGSPVTGYSFAVDDPANWTPFSLNDTQWPPDSDGQPQFWFPEAGPHTFYVRAIDQNQNITTIEADFIVFPGPAFCPPAERYVLVVLDTDPAPLIANGIWPSDYANVERALVESWFAGTNYQLFETGGTHAPSLSLMNCASSTFWFHGSDVGAGAASVLESYHLAGANALQSYSAAGGNLLLAGIRPSEALRWLQAADDGARVREDYPVAFDSTLDDPAWSPHWAATRLPIAEVDRSVGGNRTDHAELPRIRLATSTVTGGANPYPDLPWDPARWSGATRGFGYFDYDVRPVNGEVIYGLNATGTALGVQRLVAPGVLGNAVFLGFHPCFVEEAEFGALVRAVLVNFGEPTEPGR